MKRTWVQSQEHGQLGIIESVCLRNFMCHDNLTFDFDPHMNFIVGRNGSGKSAVLTGIILALGGKSVATGRHTNIKGFIKTGKHIATVCVALKNCGPEAYKPNEYGERITVERQFNSDGVSHYKLKSKSGQIISTSKEELTNILNIMDIQIENPITVLTQEISRNFLVSKNSKGNKLFQLFYSGTGLSRVEDDYKRAVQQKDEAQSEVDLKKSALPEMKKEIEQIKNLLDKSAKVTELRKELLWAMVIQFEKERDEAQEALEEVREEMSSVAEKTLSFTSEFDQISRDLAASQIEKKTANDKMDLLRKGIQEMTAKKNNLISSVRESKGTCGRYEREVQKLSNEASNLQNLIDEILLKNQNDENEGKLRHETRVNQLKQQATQVTAQIKALDEKKDFYFETIAEMNKKMDTLQAEIQDLSNSLKNVESEKRQLVAGISNRIDVFGPEMKPLLQDIKRATQAGMFKMEPKGPIGLYINVKKPEWNFAVQECLKVPFLKTFCCDSHRDADQLMKIINKHYASSRSKPSIITTKFISTVHDVSQYRTNTGHHTVLDMLDITDPVIANCLIDQKQIENLLLIADQRAAVDLMMDNPPRNCLSVYTLGGDQICHTPYRYYSCRPSNQICILKTINQEDILKKEEELKVSNAELAKRMSAKVQLQQELNQNHQEKKQIDNEFSNLRLKLKQIQMKLKDEENNFDEPKDVECLQTDLAKLQTEMKQNEDKLSSCKESILKKEQEIDTLESKICDNKNVLEEETQKCYALTAQMEEWENRKENLTIKLNKLHSRKKTLEPSLKECEKDLQEKVAATEIVLKNAENSPPRIMTKRSPDKIRQLLKETEKTVEKQRNVDRETLECQYEEKIEKYNEARSELERQEHINRHIDKMLNERFKEFKKICTNNVICLTCCFTTLLKENNFTGYPEVNLESQTLEIFAKPEKMNSKVGGSKQNLAQLSGGERSYVTIAFLLALWDRIHMPFRILDEYDVFMDPNNRHVSINLLINAAKSNRHIQYIFLSPLELPPIADSSHVKVHKMPAPKR